MTNKPTTVSPKTQFLDKLKNDKPEIPLQKVEPVTTETQPAEVRLNIWIKQPLMKRLKQKALDLGKSQKEIIDELLESYL